VIFLKIILAYITALIVFFIIVERNEYIYAFDSPENNAYSYSHSLLSTLTEGYEEEVYLVITAPVPVTKLNRLPEIAKLPGFIGGSGYIFPFLTAMNGTNFSVISLDQYCSLKKSKLYIAILSPNAAVSARQNQGNCLMHSGIQLSSGYAIDAGQGILSNLLKKYPEEKILSNQYHSEDFYIETLFKSNDSWTSGVRPWGTVTQTILVGYSPYLSLEIDQNYFKNDEHWLIFDDHPTKIAKVIDRLKTSLPKISISRQGIETPSTYKNGKYFIPLDTDTDTLNITFSEDDYIPAFGAYVLFMHNPKIQISK
jgi:hypothetical protein